MAKLIGDAVIDDPVNSLDKLHEFLDEYGDVFKSFSVLNVKPGDVIVFTTKQIVRNEFFANICKSVERAFGKEVRAIILEEGLEIAGVLRKDYGPDLRSMADMPEGDNG